MDNPGLVLLAGLAVVLWLWGAWAYFSGPNNFLGTVFRRGDPVRPAVEWRMRLALGLTFIDFGLNQWGHPMRGVPDNLVNPLCVVLVLGGLAAFAAGISLGIRLRRGQAK